MVVQSARGEQRSRRHPLRALSAPSIAAEWHPTNNGLFVPEKMRPGSNRKVWWQCSVDPSHEWQAVVANRVKGSGCPICLGRMVVPSNSLLALRPDLADEWHSEKNGDISPAGIRPRAGKKVWWRCSVDPSHEWQSVVASRANGTGCPFCAGHLATPSTCLLARYPALAAEWHPERNESLTPADVLPSSNRKAWWQCSNDPTHEWECVIEGCMSGTGCPMCRGRVATPTTSLEALYPVLAAEWHIERNGDLSPNSVRPGSQKKVWWRCSADTSHEWQSTVNNRVKGNGCPFCNLAPRSRDEIVLACELLAFIDFDLDDHKLMIGDRLLDVDILIPKLRLVVEFDGSYWHRAKSHTDVEKTELLTQIGWRVIRAREKPLKALTPHDVVVPHADPKKVADLVLVKIEQVCDVRLKNIDKYLASVSLINHAMAAKVIRKLLVQRARTRSEATELQRTLFDLDDA